MNVDVLEQAFAQQLLGEAKKDAAAKGLTLTDDDIEEWFGEFNINGLIVDAQDSLEALLECKAEDSDEDFDPDEN